MRIPLRIPPPDGGVILDIGHYRILEHNKRAGITAGWEHWNDPVVRDLEALGLLRGTWIGSLDDEPHPYWSNTQEGERALEAWKDNPWR